MSQRKAQTFDSQLFSLCNNGLMDFNWRVLPLLGKLQYYTLSLKLLHFGWWSIKAVLIKFQLLFCHRSPSFRKCHYYLRDVICDVTLVSQYLHCFCLCVWLHTTYALVSLWLLHSAYYQNTVVRLQPEKSDETAVKNVYSGRVAKRHVWMWMGVAKVAHSEKVIRTFPVVVTLLRSSLHF